MFKFILSAALILCSATSFAKESPQPEDKFSMCNMEGAIFRMAAENRDHGVSPQKTYETSNYWSGTGPFSISSQFIKRAVNLVYFDPGFTNAGGEGLSTQMMNYCMRDGKPQFQPLN